MAMRYREYLRWEGWCAITLGATLAVLGAPGLFVANEQWPLGLLFAPATLAGLAAYARVRRGVPLNRPSRWLTTRPLQRAQSDRAPLPAGPLKQRLVGETAVWILAVGAWVLLARRDGLLVFGTGLGSVVFGAVQAFRSPRRVDTAEREQGVTFVLSRRPGLGTPDLARIAGPAARGALRTPHTLPVVTRRESSRSA